MACIQNTHQADRFTIRNQWAGKARLCYDEHLSCFVLCFVSSLGFVISLAKSGDETGIRSGKKHERKETKKRKFRKKQENRRGRGGSLKWDDQETNHSTIG